jgi:hypothetical protein
MEVTKFIALGTKLVTQVTFLEHKGTFSRPPLFPYLYSCIIDFVGY